LTEQPILNRNLLALSTRHGDLSARLSRTSPSPEVFFKTAKNGSPVPLVRREGRDFPLHSLFDPEKEARKFASGFQSSGYIIVLGFGCGYHIESFLNQENLNGILVIDRDLSRLKSLISARDCKRIFLDSRVRLLIDPAPGEVRDFILSQCFPAISGTIQVLPVRSVMDLERDYFSAVFAMVKETLGLLADDFTVQTSFGKKWFCNTLHNLPLAEKSVYLLPRGKDFIITAAGPSLEESLKTFPRKDGDRLLIATDTSYPALTQRGIRPDMVISIDCQHISYHHFLEGFDSELPLILDLASPPALSRLSANPVFFTSSHPFSLYINHFWRPFPLVDTSGGNVTHAAVSLALKLGARSIKLAGADFCYPQGKSYARGAYLYPYFYSRCSRTRPGEFLFYDFVFSHPLLEKNPFGRSFLYTPRSLKEYRNRLNASFGGRGLIENLSPYGDPGGSAEWPAGGSTPSSGETFFFASGAAKSDLRTFLEGYRNDLNTLVPTAPLARYFENLPNKTRALWMTVLPAAACLRKDKDKTAYNEQEILHSALNWTLSTLGRVF
jgi:hypothetical protein